MADLSLRLLADASDTERKFERSWVELRKLRCDNCGAPLERVCSYCGNEPVFVATIDGSHTMPRVFLPEPTGGKAREE